MLTATRRRQLTPSLGLLAFCGASFGLHILGMPAAAAGLSGVLLGGGFAAAFWGLTAPTSSASERLRWLLFPQLAVVSIITWLAYLKLVPAFIMVFPHMDKVMHFLLFGAISFFAELWLRERRVFGIPVSIAVPATLAGIEEGLQHFSPHRTMDLGDLICDLSGMTLAFLLARGLYRSGR